MHKTILRATSFVIKLRNLLAVFFCANLLVPAYAGEKMRVHFIDVGQGDATLFEFPDAAILVDAGFENNNAFDGEAALTVYLDTFFSRRHDLQNELRSLIITHPHIDHTRGIYAVLDKYPPRNVVTNSQETSSGQAQQKALHRYVEGNPDDPDDDKPYCAVLLDNIPENTGLHNGIIDPVNSPGVDPKITALWGMVSSDPGWGNDRHGNAHFKNVNNHSIAFRVDFGKASLLHTGDLEEVAIRVLVERYSGSGLLDVDVYHVGHHGSKNGTTISLINAMTPDLAVIPMGPESRHDSWTGWAYGHPRMEIVGMLQNQIMRRRSPISVKVGKGAKEFESVTIEKAVYATGWDGDIVLEADHEDGSWKVIKPASLVKLINVNTASVEELKKLPAVGPVKAQAIVDHRTKIRFSRVEDLLQVKGIGPATLNRIRPLVTVGN